MLKLLLLFTFSFSMVLYGQELVRKKKTGSFEKETWFIDKGNKKKNGPFILQNLSTNDTLVSGQYRDDSISGIWSFYSKGNQIYLKYDFDTREVTYTSEKITGTDSFYIQKNGQFFYDKVDSPPLYIGYEDEIRTTIARTLKPPGYILASGQSCASIFSMEIGVNGQITKYVIEQGSDKNTDEQVLQTLKNFNDHWISAKKEGKPLVSKIFLVVRILPQSMASQGISEVLKERPYIWKVDLTYFGIVRTTTSSSSGNFPGSGGMRTK